MFDHILQGVGALEAEFTRVRHAIHQHPETGFNEHRTSKLVAERLQEWGYQVQRGIAGTGLVATLKMGNSSRVLGIRAEMDALPIVEQSGLPWSSLHPGVSHMCGHDGHTTMLLCAARYLATTRNFNGTLNLIFQPAEELLCGGSRMIDEGLFDNYPCDMLFAMHNLPGLAAGEFYFRQGVTMASGDTIEIDVNGVGGHGAFPHKATDTVLVCAHIVLALQSIVARNVDPFAPAVVTIGSLQAGDTANVIPGSGCLKLTVRTLDKAARQQVLERIETIATATAQAYGATAQLRHIAGSPVLINAAEATDFARQVGTELFGAAKCHDGVQVMASEDFAWMLEQHPNGCYINIGNGTEGANGVPVHNGHYDFNDANIVPGAALWVGITERYLACD